MAQPDPRPVGRPPLMGVFPNPNYVPHLNAAGAVQSPGRASVASRSSNNTYLLPSSPMKGSRVGSDSYKPKILRTCGSRPACLVNASVTYCGDNQLYAFGGFDQYTDEVYNHVLKLDLTSLQWTLVDNYGDIPGVRMGHTACLWQGDKLLVYGGENEHREYLSDVVVFDLKTAHWTQPEVRGLSPKGRARHAAVVHDDKLFIIGGLTGLELHTLDEICYLDLKTWSWSRSWSFVGRFDHSAWVWGGRMWVFGGLDHDMERSSELWWLDLKSSPAFKTAPEYGAMESPTFASRSSPGSRTALSLFNQPQPVDRNASGYAANSSSVQVRATSMHPKPIAPGAIASMRFISGPNVPSQASGAHFHAYSSGALLDFVTPAGTIRPSECNLSALELDSLQWQKLADGSEIFDPGYRWHYCVISDDGTKAWLLGSPSDYQGYGVESFSEYLSDILPLDLRRFGLLGNEMTAEPRTDLAKMPASDKHSVSNLGGLGIDLAGMFDRSPQSGGESDFTVTGEKDSNDSVSTSTENCGADEPQFLASEAETSPPIYVHKLILQARWPHFSRVYSAQMAEFHTKKMHIPEPYSVVRAFLYYLYTDSIATHPEYCPGLGEVAGMLVMANIYDMPRLRLLCLHRLSRELDVESAATVWERASVAGESWLKNRASIFCLTHWGRLVRTEGFRRLSRQSMMDLCEVIDVEGRVVGGEELEVVGGLGGGKFGFGGSGRSVAKGRRASSSVQQSEDMDDVEVDEDEGMEMNL